MAIKTKAKGGKRVLCALKLSRINGGVALEVRSDPDLRKKIMPILAAHANAAGGYWMSSGGYPEHDYGFAEGDYRSLQQALAAMEEEDSVIVTQHTEDLYRRETLVAWIEKTRDFIRTAWQEYLQPLSMSAELVINHYEEL